MSIRPITHAQLDWILQDGVNIPVSKQFGDVYFSRENGLAETRHVFLQGNNLAARLQTLTSHQYFCVGETGFGTGLNILALWQLWQQCRPDNHSRLHVVSIEKYPLKRTDLQHALMAWPELELLSQQLIAQYPPAIAGCHRLVFANERFSMDLWLGDAAECLPLIHSDHPIDAWFLDGFAPKCNPELWQKNILQPIIRLSGVGTTFASFSVAGLVKKGLREFGISVTRTAGFGKKREMLKAWWAEPDHQSVRDLSQATFNPCTVTPYQSHLKRSTPIAVIGAGIAGLSVAHALATRGIAVILIDQTAPLAGASGNPRALLAPQPVAIEKFANNLMNMGGLYSYRYWQQYPSVFNFSHILYLSEKKQQEQQQKAQGYPEDFLEFLDSGQASAQSNTPLSLPAIDFKQAALLNPAALGAQVLSSHLIQFQQATIDQLQQTDSGQWQLLNQQQVVLTVGQVIVCNAFNSKQLCPVLPTFNIIRGQVSWCKLDQRQHRLNMPLSYGGYVAPISDHEGKPVLLFGASFIKHNTSTEVTQTDHQHNFDLLNAVAPQVAQQLPQQHLWQGRSSLRAQVNDYLPLVGNVPNMPNVWTLSGLGSKGFSFAPLCAELLCAQLCGEVWPVTAALAKAISPQRFIKQEKIRKPYYQKPLD